MFLLHWQTAAAPENWFSLFRGCEQTFEGVARRVAIHALAPTRCRVKVPLPSSSVLSFELLLHLAKSSQVDLCLSSEIDHASKSSLQYSQARRLHLGRRRGLWLVPDMYRLSSLHAVKMNKPALRLISRLFACVTLLPVLASKAERAPAHRHEDQAD